MASYDVETTSDGMIEKLIKVYRTSTTTTGGRNMSFGALVVVGNGNGTVGVGRGKSKEVPAAIKKAMEHARRNMVTVELKDHTLQHEIVARHGAAKVFMKPASDGTGIIAGNAMRAVFEVIGIKNVLSKCVGSSNPVNVVRATLKGLTEMVSPEFVAEKRGKSVEEITE
jgi:small subunit ribosomal protein S5